jgi:hypothetical protein
MTCSLTVAFRLSAVVILVKKLLSLIPVAVASLPQNSENPSISADPLRTQGMNSK